MLDAGEEEAYFSVGKGALEVCKVALKGKAPKRILDFPSGHGRVMRWFQAEWPKAELFAVESNLKCLDFVERTFGAHRIQADPQLSMAIPGNMDLIFSGSLVTHFDEYQWDRFLPMCVDALAPDGVFIFTTHGRVHALMASARHPIFGKEVDTAELYDRYTKDGFAYSPYNPEHPTFGLSLSSPEWVMRKLQNLPYAKIIAFEEQGWGQDVWAIKKNPWPMIK